MSSDFTYVSTAARHHIRRMCKRGGRDLFTLPLASGLEPHLGGFAGQIACRAMDALEQALYARRQAHQGGLIHHSDRGSQYVSIRYTERLAKAGIEPSLGSAVDADDRASGRHWFKTTGEGLG